MILPRFSFCYNGIPFDKIDKKIENTTDGVLYTLPDGLQIECKIERYPKYNVTKWTNYWHNPTDHNSGTVSKLMDCDITVEFEADPVKTRRNKHSDWNSEMLKLFITDGANITDYDNMTHAHRLWPNEAIKAANHSGRSGMGTAPFLELNRQETGILLAVGWTGQWNSFFERGEKDVRITTCIEGVEFYMKPGEKFRTASTFILEYSDGQINAHNRWRRFIKDVVSPLGKQDRDKKCPFSAIFWGGVSSDELKSRWNDIFKENLPLDYCWMDAGWYEPLNGENLVEQTAQWQQVGIWEVNKKYHPNGLSGVISWLKSNNIGYILWFEPERICLDNKPWTKHLLPKHDENDKFVIIALNEDSILDEVIEKFGNMIEELGISWYRQDFNIGPIPFWRLNDEEGRTGVNEIRYINNLYKFWDALLERFPYLMIDNCAGGGHRIDIEALSRSVSLWQSDFSCIWDNTPEGYQLQNIGASWWYPYFGTGFGPTLGDTYSFRSAYTPALTIRTWEHVDDDWRIGAKGEPLDWARKYFNEYLSIQKYLSCDFYPLVENSKENISWAVSQYDSPEDKSGFILAFRRAKSPHPICEVQLGGVERGRIYSFVNVDTNEQFDVSSDELIDNKFILKIGEPRKSLLLKYSFK